MLGPTNKKYPVDSSKTDTGILYATVLANNSKNVLNEVMRRHIAKSSVALDLATLVETVGFL